MHSMIRTVRYASRINGGGSGARAGGMLVRGSEFKRVVPLRDEEVLFKAPRLIDCIGVADE